MVTTFRSLQLLLCLYRLCKYVYPKCMIAEISVGLTNVRKLPHS